MAESTDHRVPRVPRREVRRRLLDAAARVFAEKGIDAATVDDVAAAAGFSRGAVYSNFSGKNDLLCAMITDRIVDKVTGTLTRIESDRPIGADLPTVAGTLLADQIREDRAGQLLVLEFLARSARDGRLRGEFSTARAGQRRLVADAVRQYAAADGVELTITPEQYAVIILALVNGLAAEHLADPDNVPLDVLPVALRALWPARPE